MLIYLDLFFNYTYNVINKHIIFDTLIQKNKFSIKEYRKEPCYEK